VADRTTRKRRRFLAHACGIALAGALAAAIAASSAPEPRARPSTHVVTIEGMRFNPDTLTVQRGDRVVWINKDLFPHTATAAAKTFDSGSIAPNASWTYVVRKAGEYAYGCTFHPTMKGRLTVLADS
jgi:plastocyanin